jgi:uncharacterized protein YpuA (DUF1002 family)
MTKKKSVVLKKECSQTKKRLESLIEEIEDSITDDLLLDLSTSTVNGTAAKRVRAWTMKMNKVGLDFRKTSNKFYRLRKDLKVYGIKA